VLLLWPRSGFRSYGATDMMLCAMALGTGFGFFEDTLHGAQSYRAADSPHLLGIPVFVDSYNNFIGHGGSTALIGLGVGVLLYASRWKKWAWIGWASVGAILFWMMVDHGLANYGGSVSPDRWVAPVRWVWELDQRGALSPYIGFGLILAVMAVERALLWRTLKKFPRLPAGLCAEYVRRPLSAGLGYSQLRAAAMRVRVLGIYVMTYRQLAYTLARAPGDARLDRLELSDALAKRAGEVMMAQQAVRRS
jgi:hypothetical protein